MGCPSLQNTALVFKLHINCLQQIEIVSTMQFNGIHITQHWNVLQDGPNTLQGFHTTSKWPSLQWPLTPAWL